VINKFKIGDKVIVITDDYVNQQFQEGVVFSTNLTSSSPYFSRLGINLTKTNVNAGNCQMNEPILGAVAPWNNYEIKDLELLEIWNSPLVQSLTEVD
jgi:hypothetical protein